MNQEILYGIHPIVEALKARRRKIFECLIAEGNRTARLYELLAQAGAAGIPVKKVPPQRLDAVTGSDSHQGIAAVVSPYATVSIQDLLDRSPVNSRKRLLLLLDQVVDPHNLGALTRTALCVGIDGIVIPKNRSALPTPAVSKASAGALEHVRLSKVTNMADTISLLKKKGLWILGLEKDTDTSLYASDLTGDLAIVIGGEEKGLRPLVRKKCDYLVSIPQSAKVNSLNASVAGAVVMYEAFRQRLVAR